VGIKVLQAYITIQNTNAAYTQLITETVKSFASEGRGDNPSEI